MPHPLHRRDFFRRSALTGAALWVAGSRSGLLAGSANEKLNIGIIGTANRASANINGVSGENIIAICDIDQNYLGRASEKFPRARIFQDFRKMLDECQDLDAVVVSTADHTHAPATVRAMKQGLHAYCEKPLSHSVHEARVMAETAAEAGVATQLGTQIHSNDNYRRVVELIQSGAIGPVREVHVWCAKVWGGGDRPTDSVEVPQHLNWDLWLGPAPERPYHSTYHPANWRRWWDFGSGTLGDMGCHVIDLAFWALDLKSPTHVEASGSPVHEETAPETLTAHWDFPARGVLPPVKLSWYDGPARPEALSKPGMPDWGLGVLFVGDDGFLAADYGRRVLLPEEKFQDFEAPGPSIPSSPGHYVEWIEACKSGDSKSKPLCHFGDSGPLTETVLLGTVAYRLGQPLDWDAAALKATNCPEADRLIRREYRKGWEL
ncbi:Gfo/Idh/MocA family oxidoreductase [soil metagenome]